MFDAAASSGPETSGPLRVARDARDSLFSPVSGIQASHGGLSNIS